MGWSGAWAAVAAVAVVGSSLVGASAPAVAVEDVVVLPPGEVAASAAELPGPVERVELADGVLVVQAGGQVLWRGLDDVGGEWSSTWGGLPLTGDLVDAEGDVVLTQAGADGPGTLTWAFDGGGSREVPAGTVLGRGGQHVAWPTDDVSKWRVEPVTDGTGGVLVPANGRVVLWGDRVATSVGALGYVQSRQARTGELARSLGIPCDWIDHVRAIPRPVDRTQRWILTSCDGQPFVHDDAGDLPAPVYRAIRVGLTGFDVERLQLGDGVVVGFADDVLTAVPVLGGSSATMPGSVAFDLDDDGRTIVHVDAQGDLRIAGLGAVASPMLTVSGDTTPPVAQGPEFYSGGIGIGDTSPTRTYEVIAGAGWDPWTDPIYLASDVASAELRHGPTSTGPWTAASGTHVTVTFAPGSQECWQARATDNAGNASAWTGPECIRVDGAAPVVSPKTPPSVTKARATGSTAVKFSYSAKDLALDTYDVRYRVTLKGRSTATWVYPSTHQKTTATSITVSAPRSSVACFSVRARDRVGNTSSWSGARCTYLDGTAPKLTRTWMSDMFLAPKDTGAIVWWPRYAVAATDDRGVAAYQFQQRRAFGSSAGTTTSAWGSRRTVTDGVEPSEQSCRRSRAKDAVGNVSPWSRWRCTQAPLTPSLDWNRYVRSSYITEVGRTDVVVVAKNRWDARTDGYSTARIVRVKLRTGPNEGRAQVFVGDRYIGTISGKSSTVGWKWVTVRASQPGKGRLRFKPITYAPTRIATVYVMRWQP